MPFEAPPAKLRTALVADLFCGAGGSSSGAKRALEKLGYSMTLSAVNHWNIAIDTHSKNFPEARHVLHDVTTADPEAVVPEGKLDLLMASPECRFHSRARGGKPIHDQGRMDAWAVTRWCTALRVKRLLVENVPEFVDFGPLDLRTGRPIKRRRGEYFRAWVRALEGLGFKVEWRILNAADYGDATTRERFFLMARSDGRRIVWPEPTHSRTGDATFFGPMKKWRSAREIIDWSLEGKSIFDRKRALSPKTLARIYAGAVKFKWPEPFLVILRNHMDAQSVDGPLPTITTGGGKGGSQLYLAEPFILNRAGDNGGTRAHSLDAPMPTATGRGAGYLAEPFQVLAESQGGNGANVRPLDDPIYTVTTRGNIGLVEPFTLSPHTSGAPRSVAEPLATITTGGASNEAHPGCARPAVIEPFIANLAHAGYDASRVRSTGEPLQTLHAGGGSHGLVEPFVLSQASAGAPRGVSQPISSLQTDGAHALIAPYYGEGSGKTCKTVEKPLDTVTAKARFGLVMPVTHADGGNRARSLEEPIPTVTTAHRGELACIVAAFGERPGQAPRVHSVDEPTPTICAEGRIQLAVAEPVVTDGRLYDIRFRMLEPKELARAMGFSDDEVEYEFSGTKTDVVRQIGNAVCVHMAAALVGGLFKH